MKREISILILFLFAFHSVIAQHSRLNSFEVSEKYEKATIHFLDGTSIKGYGKLVGFKIISNQKYKVKFKASMDSKPDVWTDLMIKGITFHYDFDDITYLYVKLSERTFPRLLQVMEEGAINLYIEVDSYWLTSDIDSKTGFPKYPSYKEEEIYYFLERKADSEVLILSSANTASGAVRSIFSNFKKKVKSFFDDCDGIKNKLDSREFNRATIPEIVYYYNDFCAEYE